MHGVIFTAFRDYVTVEFGDGLAAEILRDEPTYLLSEAYEDERLSELIRRASELTGNDADEILHGFGVFAGATTFTRLYPAYFALAGGARQFLLTVEDRIHELVRATIPNARPPQLHVVPLGDDSVQIVYTSPRRLCVLLRGLAAGTARHYGEHAEIEERECMRRGDPACLFEVRLSPLAPGA